MATVERLKEIIVDLKVALRNSYIPKGHCPYAYYSVEGAKDIDCDSFDCDLCRREFMELYRKQVKKEVESL